MVSFFVWLPVWAMPDEQEYTPAINPGIPIEKRSTKYYKQLVPELHTCSLTGSSRATHGGPHSDSLREYPS